MFDQDKWVHERQVDWFRKTGLVKQPYIHENLRDNGLILALKKPFGAYGPPGNFVLAKHVSGRQKMSSTEVLRPQGTDTFNTLKMFWENSAYCYLVPAGWEDPSRHPPARREREERWWRGYKALTERLRQERNLNSKKDKGKADNQPHDGANLEAKQEWRHLSSTNKMP